VSTATPSSSSPPSSATCSASSSTSSQRSTNSTHTHFRDGGFVFTSFGSRRTDGAVLAIGRFIQQDSYRGNIGNPPSLHRYIYVYNNPIRYTDPSGHNPVAIAIGVLGAGIAIGAELLSALLIYLIIFLAIMAVLYCWTNPVCKRFVKCFMQFLGRAFKCLLVALDIRTVDREACIINCIKAAWERIKKCRSGFGNYYPMPWDEIKAGCRTPPIEPGDDDDDDGGGKEWWDQYDRAA
jgi:hypothetical protein